MTENPLPVINAGHSQGGGDALAVHRYMETSASDEERLLFPLERSWCADGPYAPDIVNEIVCRKEKYLYGAYSVMSVMSHHNYHPECFDPNIGVADFLTDEGAATGIIDAILSRKIGNRELINIVISNLGPRTANLFRSDAYLPEGMLYKMIEASSKAERQIDGWRPSLPISFYHLYYDECVPVETMLEVKQLWGELPNVSFVEEMTLLDDIPNRMGHAYSGLVFHRNLLRHYRNG